MLTHLFLNSDIYAKIQPNCTNVIHINVGLFIHFNWKPLDRTWVIFTFMYEQANMSVLEYAMDLSEN